jgi:hypothetical protein
MGRGAHPVVEDTFGRLLIESNNAGVDEPLLDRKLQLLKRGAKRLHPYIVFMDDMNFLQASGLRKNRGGMLQKSL